MLKQLDSIADLAIGKRDLANQSHGQNVVCSRPAEAEREGVADLYPCGW